MLAVQLAFSPAIGYWSDQRGDMFGTIQALGGLASFVTALVNSLHSGVRLIAPFICCGLSMAVVAVWAMRLPEDAKKYTDRKTADQPNAQVAEAG